MIKIATLILGIMLTISIVATHLGVTASGVPETPTVENVGILGALEWAFDSIGTYFQLLTFQVEGLPEAASFGFLILTFAFLFVLVKLVRG